MISQVTKNRNDLDFAAGEVILIDKKLKLTSFDVVFRVRKTINVKKVGHAGTLDPLATGLLIICTGKKTKEIYKYQDKPKIYSGIIRLGERTPSMDSETEVNETHPTDSISEEMITAATEKFTGEIEQVPPMYSALKHKGKALYKYARKGKEIVREPRKVEISRFEIKKIDMPDIYFEIECSKGTYIRVIADDFGQKLNCGGYLKSLRREAIGEFDVSQALEIEEFMSLYSK